jgi:hypothetical protein
MKIITNVIALGVCLLMSGGLMAQTQLADTLDTSRMDAASRTLFAQEIEQARTQHASSFETVQDIVDRAAEIDRTKRGRLAPFTLFLKRAGGDTLFALIEQVAFQPTPRSELKDSAWIALQSGLLEAIGRHRDARAVPVLEAVLRGEETEFYIVRAAASALGNIANEESVGILIELANIRGDKQIAILAGMGSCRRAAVATFLAEKLNQSTSIKQADILVHSLEEVGNEWAWETPAIRVYAEEEESTRSIAAEALFHAFQRFDSPIRTRIATALMVVGHPDTPSLIHAANAEASKEDKVILEGLLQRFNHHKTRMR